eukprot:gene12494-9370_t
MVKLIVGVLLAISARAEKPGPTPARFNAPAPSSKTQPTPSPGLRALRRSEWTKYTALSINDMITPEDVHGDGDGMVAVIPGEVMAKAMRDGVCPGSGGAPLLAEDYNSRAFNWEYYINIVEKSVNCILPDTFKNFSLETVTLGSMPNLEMIYTYAFR